MRFNIATQEFNFLINKCLNVVSSKATIPVLSNLLIEAANDELSITATDLTVGIRCFTDAKIIEEGATTLPAKKLAQLLRELTAVNIEISTHSNDITEIVADGSKFKIHGMSKAEYPSLPNMEGAVQIKMPQKDFRDMLFRTAFAVSRDDNRYILTGVYMQIAEGEVVFIGTDGKRLCKAHASIAMDESIKGSYVIPLKAVEEILKNLTDEGELQISLLPDKIAIESNQTVIITKLLCGEYPDITRVIPEHSEATVDLHREELMTLLRQVSLFTAEGNHSVRFSFSSGELQLSATTRDLGEGKVSMLANYRGPQLDIAFNAQFFLDILRHTRGETITLGLTDPYNPGIITDITGTAPHPTPQAIFVLMPLHINEE